MNSALYPGLSVTPRDVWYSPDGYDIHEISDNWTMPAPFRRGCIIGTGLSQPTHFLLEGVAMRLVVPGVNYEKDVLRPGTKRVLTRSR